MDTAHGAGWGKLVFGITNSARSTQLFYKIGLAPLFSKIGLSQLFYRLVY